MTRYARKPHSEPSAPESGAKRPHTPAAEDELKALHDAAGNQAVNRLVQAQREPGDTATGETEQSGRPLPEAERTFFESRLGSDLRDVRVHTDEEATRQAARKDAEAVTIGADIYFAPGAYRPESASGRMVLGHELAHVAQSQGNAQRAPEPHLEAEATVAGLQAAAGQPAAVSLSAGAATPLALTRKDRVRRGLIGSAIGLGVAGAALGVAAVLGASLGVGLILGALGGGLLAGGLLGYFAKRTKPVDVKEADQLIRGRYGKNLTAAIAAGTSAAGSNIQVVDDKQFRAAYTAAGLSPDDYETVGGFVDRSTKPPTVWIHKERQKPVTVLHEALHIYSHQALRTDPGITGSVKGSNYVNEGCTQYFTEQIADEQYISLEGISTEYRRAAAEVRALAELVGEDTVRHAYFEGDVAGLRAAVDALHGAGTFDAWAAAVNGEDWSGARRLLNKGKK